MGWDCVWVDIFIKFTLSTDDRSRRSLLCTHRRAAAAAAAAAAAVAVAPQTLALALLLGLLAALLLADVPTRAASRRRGRAGCWCRWTAVVGRRNPSIALLRAPAAGRRRSCMVVVIETSSSRGRSDDGKIGKRRRRRRGLEEELEGRRIVTCARRLFCFGADSR